MGLGAGLNRSPLKELEFNGVVSALTPGGAGFPGSEGSDFSERVIAFSLPDSETLYVAVSDPKDCKLMADDDAAGWPSEERRVSLTDNRW